MSARGGRHDGDGGGERGSDSMRAAMVPVAAIGAALTVGAFALFSGRVGASVLVGALIASSNLYVLIRVVEALLTPDPEDGADPGTSGASDVPAEAEPGEGTPPEAGPEDDEGRASGAPPPATQGGFSAAWAGLGMLKMLVLFGGIWFLMTRALVDPIALVVGYGSLPIGISLRGLVPALRPRKPGPRTPRGRPDAR